MDRSKAVNDAVRSLQRGPADRAMLATLTTEELVEILGLPGVVIGLPDRDVIGAFSTRGLPQTRLADRRRSSSASTP